MNPHDLKAWRLFAVMKRCRSQDNTLPLEEELRKIASIVGVGMLSIQRQYETWPTRTLYYRRHLVETQLRASCRGRYRRLAWLRFLWGAWDVCIDDQTERIELDCDFHDLSITWKAGRLSRKLDWSWHGFNNTFTLVGGDSKRIIRWRPSIRHYLFDDDHVVWVPHSTKHVVLVDKDVIVYTRVDRTLKYFQDVDPRRWCCLKI